MQLRLERREFPVCQLMLVTDENGVLRALDFASREQRMLRLLGEHYGTYTLEPADAPAAITDALEAYFAGDMNALDAVEIATRGTPFQREVWRGLRGIPVGTTTTYGRLAETIGRVGASRAVGAANGANPIAIVVPCHRVIGANGNLTGFAGGLDNKRWLLDHEMRYTGILAECVG